MVERLQMAVPVYVVFTKCDLLPGFVETFRELRKDERGQLWGMTFPLDQSQTKATELFSERFDELCEVLRARSFLRMEQDRRFEERAKIYQFPQQFAALKSGCVQFANEVFASDVYHESPLLRGAYFTSGTQEGRPVDLLTASLSEAFGVALGGALSDSPVDTKSYFLRDVFA